MKSIALSSLQFRTLAALKEFAARRTWKGDIDFVENTLVYQIPLREHPDVTGAFFAMEGDDPGLRLYLTLPGKIDASRLAEAYEFAVRHGYGHKFGALEMSPEHGSLRIRMDADTTPDSVAVTADRLVTRGLAVAREVSPAWRALCQAQGVAIPRDDNSETTNSDRKQGI